MCARNNTVIAILFLSSLLVISCATPIPPTGGLVERSSPKILSSVPQTGAIQFNGQSIRIDFDRFISRNSVQRAIQIEPDLGIPYSINWKRKSMILQFDSPFPDSVTVIVSLGADIADVNGNRLTTPYQIAFSTGAYLDSASVHFNVYSFDQAKGVSGQKVGLFRDGIDDAAVYIAESDTSGVARFRYVSRGSYTARLFDDRNRNRKVDENEFAVSLSQKVNVEGDSLNFGGNFVYSRQDTTSPDILGVGLLSSDRIRIRFSESIRLSNTSSLSIIDSKGNRFQGTWLYSDPIDASIAIARSSINLDPNQSYKLELDSITDSMGNIFNGNSPPFAGSSRPDTTVQRIIRFPEPSFVLPNDTFLVVYSDIIRSGAIADSIIVIDGENQIKNWKDTIISDNKLYVFRKEGWIPGQSYQIRYWSPKEQRHRNLSFRVQREEDLANLELLIPENWQKKSIIIELLDINGAVLKSIQEQSANERITISALEPATYRLRVWLDANLNRRWDQKVSTLNNSEHEKIFILPRVNLSARMTSIVQIDEIF